MAEVKKTAAEKALEAKQNLHLEKIFNSITRKDWQGAATVDIRREDVSGEDADEWALFIMLAHKVHPDIEWEDLNDRSLIDLVRLVYPRDLLSKEVQEAE